MHNVFKFKDASGVKQKIMRHNIDDYFRTVDNVLGINYRRNNFIHSVYIKGADADTLESAIDNGVLDIMIGDDEA